MSKTTIFFDQVLESAGVDTAAGIVRGVSIITSGVTARGHDLEVDDTTVMQMFEKCVEKGQVSVKWNHKTGADAVNGYLKNFRIEGKKLKADWHLLKSHERYDHAMEMAEKMPQNVGLSASFTGKDELIGGRKHARCNDVISVDLVSSPAANPSGLFSSKVDDTNKDDMENDLKELKDLITGIATELGTIKNEQAVQRNEFNAFQQSLHEFADGEEDGEEEEEQEEEEGEVPDTELGRLEQCVRHLSAKFLEADEREAQHELDSAFASLDERITQLEEINEQLSFENAAMAEALQEFEQLTGTTVEFSAGSEGGFVPRVLGANESAATDFEDRVVELEAAGKAKTDAIMLAVKENPARYQKHLSSLRERNLG
jgi:vacuolar-type H+-ATPase subunit I/STV1